MTTIEERLAARRGGEMNMSDAKEIDHDFTHEITCPHCGQEISDSWELSGNEDGQSGTEECQECGKSFEWCCSVSVSYSTEKLETAQPTPEKVTT
jgi:transcription elongation factor Elf1